jgi:tRNA nucleotidyltransferase/poly(A) polymerase
LLAKTGKAKKKKPITAKAAVLQVVRRLRREGYEALLAGGCVRDMLLGKAPKDYDVATNATPQAVTELFDQVLMVGAKFGVAMVLWGGRQIEVATFRSDDFYVDGRRPEKVVFTDARHDAQRRDFTINGMFYDPLADEVIDYVDGKKDLNKGIIRAIGNAGKRFAEDHLRMLRAVRFAGRLDFEIEDNTWDAICDHAKKLKRISAERVASELEYILVDPNRKRGLRLAYDSGLLSVVFPLLTTDQLNFGINVAEQLPKNCSLALALSSLLLDCDGKKAGRICRDLKASNNLRKQVCWLLENHETLLDAIPMSRGRLKQWLAMPLFDTLVQLNRAYLKATLGSREKLRILRRQIEELGDEPVAPPRLLNGLDLIRLGATPGPMVGQLVEELYLTQLENEVSNKTEAHAWVQKWLACHKEK